MSLLRIDQVVNGNSLQDFKIYKCDMTGEEIPECDPHFGNDDIHLTDKGIEMLMEQWIHRYANGFCGYPIILKHLEEQFTRKYKPNRYVSEKLKSEVLNSYKQECLHCGNTENLEFDHIKPISKGGLTEFKNLQILCKTCNLKKGTKHNDEAKKTDS